MGRKYVLLSILPLIFSSILVGAETPASTAQGFEGINIGAGLAIGLAVVGAGVAVGMAAAAGIGVLTERRDMFGTVLIFVIIGEGLAVYGILFGLLMLFAKI